MVETATGARWELPGHVVWQELQAISPTVRRFAQSGPRAVELWTLPVAPAEFRRWLDQRTNAITSSDDVLIWARPSAP